MNKEKEAKRYIGLIVLLLLLIVAISVLSYQNASDYSKLKDVFNEEKKEIESNLDNIIDNYENAVISKKHITQKLKEGHQNLILLRDTISNLKELNYRLIKFYRKKILKLEEINNNLFIRLDSLYDEHSDLLEENVYLSKKNSYLSRSKKNLENKIANATVIDISKITVEPLKKRNNGKYVSTSRSSRTDAFRIRFNVLKNRVIDAIKLPIHIQLLDFKNKIIFSKGTTKLKNGKTIIYSKSFLLDYYNKTRNVVSSINVNRDSISKGIYTIKIYVNHYYSGESKIKLR